MRISDWSFRRVLFRSCGFRQPLSARSAGLPAHSRGPRLALVVAVVLVGHRVGLDDHADVDGAERSDERGVGKECVSMCRLRWSQDINKNKNTKDSANKMVNNIRSSETITHTKIT